MIIDKFPFHLLWRRFFDLILSVVSIVLVFYLVVDIVILKNLAISDIRKLSVASAIVGVYLEYTQKNFYEKNPIVSIERSLIYGELTTDTKILEFVAKARNYLAQRSVMITVSSMMISVFYG